MQQRQAVAQEGKQQFPALDSNYLVVVAIDFGTAFSGYAFSFKSEPDDIKINRNWGHSVGSSAFKTPTCILFGPDETIKSFGYDAQKEYAELEDGDDQNYYLFEFFKMELHGKTKLDAKLTASNGKTMESLTVFAKSIQWLKDHFFKYISDTTKKYVTTDDVRWVITVPAIWSYKSKNFMRQAAYKGGLLKEEDSDKLVIALEPESASLFCRSLDINQYADVSREHEMQLKPGTKYLVLDAGGGTLDVTVHEVQGHNKAKELEYATGGPFGGMYVDREYVQLLEDILGNDYITSFKKEYPSQWLQMMVDFEQKKRACNTTTGGRINLTLTYSFGTYYNVFKDGEDTIEAAFKRKKTGVKIRNGMIAIEHKVVVQLFDKVTTGIVEHFKKLLVKFERKKLGKIDYIFMVGGFSDCNVLQSAVINAFPKMKVMIPQEASLAVVKGAVRFGHDPSLITERISNLFYGVKVRNRFDPKIHHMRHRKIDANTNEHYCHVFDVFLKKYAPMGDYKVGSYQPVHPNQKQADIEVFSSEEEGGAVRYIADDDVTSLGTMTVPWPDHGNDRVLDLYLRFGGTEIDVMAECQPGNKITKGSVNC